jgi:FkbM family methyltransferase
MYYSDLESYFLSSNLVTVQIDGRPIEFDTHYPHDRQYLAKLLFNVKIPQVDIDSALFGKFICQGDKVLDVGANIGFTAIECIKAGASNVISIEPVPQIFTRLAKTCQGWNIFPLQMALANVPGYMDMTISKLHNHGSTLKAEVVNIFPQVFGENPDIIRVPVSTLDDVIGCHGKFDVWKLDVEGAEVDALQGAIKALAESVPRVIIVEIYNSFLDDFVRIISQTHPYAARAFLCKSDYCLELTDIRVFDEKKYEKTSPMYVFSINKLSN